MIYFFIKKVKKLLEREKSMDESLIFAPEN